MDLPKVIETPDFQEKLKNRIQGFTARYKVVAPDYEAPTPADPLYHVFVEMTLLEVLGIEKVNAAAYAQLLKLSNDIEFISKGKIRPGESYETFRERVRGMKDQASPAGSMAMYKALTFLYGEATLGEGTKARSAAVLDAYVEPVNNEQVKGALLIHVFINSKESDLQGAVLSSLKSEFAKESVLPALDVVTFQKATAVPIKISAIVNLSPGYGMEYKKTIEDTFRAKFESQVRLGWAPTSSWIVKELHQVGVRSVILTVPSTSPQVQKFRYAAIDSLDLTVEAAA